MDGCPWQDPAYRATYAKAPLKRGAFASLRVYDQRRTAESRVEVNVYSAAEEDGMAQRRVVIMGAAGRDFMTSTCSTGGRRRRVVWLRLPPPRSPESIQGYIPRSWRGLPILRGFLSTRKRSWRRSFVMRAWMR